MGGGGYLVYFADGMCTPFKLSILTLGIELEHFSKAGCQRSNFARVGDVFFTFWSKLFADFFRRFKSFFSQNCTWIDKKYSKNNFRLKKLNDNTFRAENNYELFFLVNPHSTRNAICNRGMTLNPSLSLESFNWLNSQRINYFCLQK